MKLNEPICLTGLTEAQSKCSLSYNEGHGTALFYYPAFRARGPAVDYSSHMLKMCRVFSLFVLLVELLFICFSRSQPA